MATYYSTYQTAQRGSAARDVRPDRSALARHRRVATFEWTGTSGLANAEYVVLGKLGIAGARIVADQCKIRYKGSGTLDVKFTLQKRDNTATATALTAITSTITAVTSATSLANVSGAGDLPTVAIDDDLELLLSTGASAVTVPSTATVVVEVVYDVPGA